MLVAQSDQGNPLLLCLSTELCNKFTSMFVLGQPVGVFASQIQRASRKCKHTYRRHDLDVSALLLIRRKISSEASALLCTLTRFHLSSFEIRRGLQNCIASAPFVMSISNYTLQRSA
ncbi:unnamed protein product [Alternaria burnsii]|nr:unnamed protein product [Alternaria burnsii]